MVFEEASVDEVVDILVDVVVVTSIPSTAKSIPNCLERTSTGDSLKAADDVSDKDATEPVGIELTQDVTIVLGTVDSNETIARSDPTLRCTCSIMGVRILPSHIFSIGKMEKGSSICVASSSIPIKNSPNPKQAGINPAWFQVEPNESYMPKGRQNNHTTKNRAV